jgi:hypothetical protein
MSTWLIAVVTIIYVSIAVSFAWEGNFGMCIVWSGYAIANIGFILLGTLS